MASTQPSAGLHGSSDPPRHTSSITPKTLSTDLSSFSKEALSAYIKERLGCLHSEKEDIEVLDLDKGVKAMLGFKYFDSDDDISHSPNNGTFLVTNVEKAVMFFEVIRSIDDELKDDESQAQTMLNLGQLRHNTTQLPWLDAHHEFWELVKTDPGSLVAQMPPMEFFH